jgi:GNAT superfamily N-acetyltransferase
MSGNVQKKRLQIRAATEADLPALTAMTRAHNDYLDAIGGADAAIGDGEAIARAAMDRLHPMAFGPNPICTVLMAELEGEIAGYVNYYVGVYMDDAMPVLHVADFFVNEHQRRHGVGRALMLEVRRVAQTLGATRVLWTVWRKNEAAIRFYHEIGAEADGESLLMQWPVPKPPE